MPRFRLSYGLSPAPEGVAALIEDVLRPGHFFVGPGVALAWASISLE